jgi:hypothetical protein
MSNETRRPTPDADADEATIIAWFHKDAGAAYGALEIRARRVADLVRAFGLVACLAERLELERLARITCELSSIQFADLKETYP